MTADDLGKAIQWHRDYRPDWDATPWLYTEAGVVGWGKSRRLGKFQVGNLKAYLGVQHIDPSLPGWNIVQEPETRVFLSIFVEGRVVALRSFPSMGAALEMLLAVVNSSQ